MDNIEISFGAYDSETMGWEYTIPKGFTAKIEDGKIIVKKGESEDERVRKELIDFISWSVERHFMREDFHQAKRPAEWVAWLEKQKEPENVSASTMIPSCWAEEPSLHKEQKPIKHCDNNTIDGDLNDYVCRCYNALQKGNGGVLSFARLQHLAMDIWQWCKEQQKPAEWSEEDEKMRNALWNLLKIQYAQDYSLTGVGIEAGKFRDWLRSLRPPQYCENCKLKRFVENWKPSEEQMEALTDCVIGNEYDVHALVRLWAELKKL